MSSAIEQLRQAGLDLTDAVLEKIRNDLQCDPDTLSAPDLLLGLGLGDYDYDTGEWTPRSGMIYAFDAEIFDVDRMYTLFLQGVQAIVPDIRITDVREDLSQMTDEMTVPEDGLHPPTDGKRSVSFLCNSHAYSVELDSYGDWFNESMLNFMDDVLEKENCPFRLCCWNDMQFVFVVYGTKDKAEKIIALTGED